jgi:hypothetical protein
MTVHTRDEVLQDLQPFGKDPEERLQLAFNVRASLYRTKNRTSPCSI